MSEGKIQSQPCSKRRVSPCARTVAHPLSWNCCGNCPVSLSRGFIPNPPGRVSSRPLSARIDTEDTHQLPGQQMIRTVWLGIMCLVLVSALAGAKALRMPAEPAVAELLADETTVGIGDPQDTLSKADRLAINHVRQEIPQPVLQTIEPAAPIATPPKQPEETKIISRHWRDPNAFSSKNSKQTKQAGSNKTSKNYNRKRNQAAERSKSAEPMKSCRPGPFGDLLRSVNLSPACPS